VIVSETDDAGIVIEKIELDAELERRMEMRGYLGRVRLVGSDELTAEIRVSAKQDSAYFSLNGYVHVG
jgi:hypothetical protein